MYKFIYVDEANHEFEDKFPFYIEMQFNDGLTWDELLQGFIQFLKGSGYLLPHDAVAHVIDEQTGEDLSMKVRSFKDKYLNEEDNEDTTD